MSTELVMQTQFSFPPPKQFYRKIEAIFDVIDKIGPPEIFASAFLRIFYQTLAEDFGVTSVHLYERHGGCTELVTSWGDHEEAPRQLTQGLFLPSELPWVGNLNNDRKAAVVPLGEGQDFFMVFIADQVFAYDPSFVPAFASAFSSLHYALLQNLKWMQLKDTIEQARSIQKSLLPSTTPQLGDFDIAAASISAMQVGGDVFDFQSTRPGILSVTIADAAGHGLAAALQARDVITGIRMGVASDLEIRTIAANLNRVIHQSGLVSRFVSVIHGELCEDGFFHYVNAGHPLPLILDSNGFRQLESTGMILGPQADSVYGCREVELPPGSALVLFTDGVIEHHREDGTEFGIEGLKSWMQDWQIAPAAIGLRALLQRLYDFGNARAFHDDVTAVYIRRLA